MSQKMSDYYTRERVLIDNKNLSKFKNMVIDMIENGALLKDLLKETKLPVKQLNRLIEKLGCTDARLNNSAREKQQRAIRNWKKCGIKLKGVELKPITKQHEEDFLRLKNDEKHRAEITRYFIKKYGFHNKKIQQLIDKFGELKKWNGTGKNNPMYGRSPSSLSGFGISGHLLIGKETIFFRSSLELKVYLWLSLNNISFKLSKHRIKYKNSKGIERTYNPDIVIDKKIYEIKPRNLISTKKNRIKFSALDKYCKKFNLEWGIIDEYKYPIKKEISIAMIEKLIKADRLILIDRQLDRLRNSFKEKQWK